jgi:hypothetical protein
LTIGGFEKIDLKLDRQDAMILRDQAESGIPRRMVSHRGYNPGMNVMILLPVAI